MQRDCNSTLALIARPRAARRPNAVPVPRRRRAPLQSLLRRGVLRRARLLRGHDAADERRGRVDVREHLEALRVVARLQQTAARSAWRRA